MDRERVACKIGMRLLAQRQNNRIFFWLPYTVALARLLLESTPGEQCSETLLRSSPTLQTLPLPRHSPPFTLIRQPVKRV